MVSYTVFMDNLTEISEKLAALSANNSLLEESYAQMAAAILRYEDEGWSALGTMNEDGFTSENLHRVASHIREQSEGNPLLKRGIHLRSSYVLGRGVNFESDGKIAPRIKRIIDNTKNQEVLFSPEAMAINEHSHFTDGQFFLLGSVADKTFQRVPFSQVSGVVTDPDDAEVVWFYRRSWTRTEQKANTATPSIVQMNVWYPTDAYPQNSFAGTIQGYPVDFNSVMFASRVNRRAGQIWGVPDAFPAVPWAYAYNEYLKDGSRMLKALSMFAWQLKSKTKTGATNAAASIANNGTVASTAVLGADMELASMPRTGSTVDLGNGRPLAAMVAAALEVSIVALLSDPGQSGAYGTAQTLDVPTLKAMEARQNIWTGFFNRIFAFIGADNVTVNWPKIDQEPAQRMMQSLALAKEAGALWDDEFRDAVIEVLDITKKHADMPPKDVPVAPQPSAVPSQGNSGAVGSMQSNTNDTRKQDNKPTV